MARIVLVHGAFGRAACWDRVAPGLRAAGHTVQAIDLPGQGDDPTPVEQVTLDRYAERVCEALAEGPPAVLVGHSMGGMVITQAAARCPSLVSRLVYVTAFLPWDGMSLIDMTQLPEGAGDQVQANLVVDGDPPVATMAPEAVREALCHCADDEAGSLVGIDPGLAARRTVHESGGPRRPGRRHVRGAAARVRDVPPGPGDQAGAPATDARDGRL